MRAIILGAGKVGYSIALMLSKEKHNVVVIEQNLERAQIVSDNLDVQVIIGNCASSETLEQCNIGGADLLVAVTESDELNMLACMRAKQYGVARTVARVRSPEYADDDELVNNKALGIDLVINPERVTAKEISNIACIREALMVNYYADGKLMMIELKIPPNSAIIGKKLRELPGTKYYVITALLHNGELIIPGGEDIIQENDHIFVVSKKESMIAVEKALGFEREKVNSIMILSGSRVAYYLAKYLENDDFEVKVIEKDYKTCKWMSGLLDKTIVLNGDGSDIDLLQSEGISDVDVLIALTEDDKLNVLVSLLGKQLGAKKTIAQIRRSDYLPLIQKVGIDVCVSPQTLTSEAILKFVRKGNYLSISILENGNAEVYEVILTEKMKKLINKPLKSINFPKGAIIAAIFREDQVIIPSGDDLLQVGDRITVFTSMKRIGKMETLFG